MKDNLEERMERIIKNPEYIIIPDTESKDSLKQLIFLFRYTQKPVNIYKILKLLTENPEKVFSIYEIGEKTSISYINVLNIIMKLYVIGAIDIINKSEPIRIYKINKDKLVELDKCINNREEFEKYIESKNIRQSVKHLYITNYYIIKEIYNLLQKNSKDLISIEEILNSIRTMDGGIYNLTTIYNFLSLFVRLGILENTDRKKRKKLFYVKINKNVMYDYSKLLEKIEKIEKIAQDNESNNSYQKNKTENYMQYIDYIAFSILNAVKNNKGYNIVIPYRTPKNIEELKKEFKTKNISLHTLAKVMKILYIKGIIRKYPRSLTTYYITRDDEVYKKAKECLKIYNNIKDSVGCLSKYIKDRITRLDDLINLSYN